jgi:hypothetical protein
MVKLVGDRCYYTCGDFLLQLIRFLAVIIDNSCNQIITIPFFKENIPSRSIIIFVKNVVGA